MQEIWVQSLGREDPLEKEMATHSSILAWEVPWPEEPGGLQSSGITKSWTWMNTATTLGQLNAKTFGNSYLWDWARLTGVCKKARPFMAIILLLLLRECDRPRRVCGDLSRFTIAMSPVKDGEKHKMNHPMGSKGRWMVGKDGLWHPGQCLYDDLHNLWNWLHFAVKKKCWGIVESPLKTSCLLRGKNKMVIDIAALDR